jgi:hypothetical protein
MFAWEWRHLQAHETDHERLWLSVSLAGAALALLWQASGPSELPVFRCPFKMMTGCPCITCGGTRATLALLRGAPLEALRWNPLVTATLFGLTAYGVYAAIVSTFHLPRLRIHWSPAYSRSLRAAVWLTLAANWIFLIVDGR